MRAIRNGKLPLYPVSVSFPPHLPFKFQIIIFFFQPKSCRHPGPGRCPSGASLAPTTALGEETAGEEEVVEVEASLSQRSTSRSKAGTPGLVCYTDSQPLHSLFVLFPGPPPPWWWPAEWCPPSPCRAARGTRGWPSPPGATPPGRGRRSSRRPSGGDG